jgi:hypothetical protein
LYEVFLVFPEASLRTERLHDVGLGAVARLAGVDLYYRADTDLALIALRLDARLATHHFLERLRDEAAEAGAAVLEPARLAAEERARFTAVHLGSYPLRVGNFPTVADAARKLAADLGALPQPGPAAPERRVEVRVRRGDAWALGRARSLTREGIYVYSGCALRVGEKVELELSSDDARVTTPAEVVHVTSDDPALTVGGAGFGARFLTGPEAQKGLEALVASGRAGGLGTLRAAPARCEARYPLRWPVAVTTRAGRAELAALDVSRRGMFVATDAVLDAAGVELSLPCDASGRPIVARARVARAQAGAAARARGAAPGYGLELHDFHDGDRERFHDFVRRVGQRAGRQVVVGAGAERVGELVAQLAGSGYVAAGVTDAALLVHRVARARPDLVLLDPSLGTDAARRSLRRRLRVPSYELERQVDERSLRTLADAALLDATTLDN